MPLSLTAVRRYPVKSCRGHDVDSAVVEPWGLAGDRRWALVDDDGVAVTARRHPRMVLITPEPADDGLLLRAPGAEPLAVPVPGPGPLTDVRVFSDTVGAVAAAPAAHAWFGEVLGAPVRLMYLDDPRRRPVDPAHGRDTDVVSFADGYPLLLTTQESLADLDARTGGAAPLSMTRFRPNLVIAGAPAWAEDGWRRVRVGDATFRVVKACDRCVLTAVDPETAETGPEPLRTLARHRRWDGKVWFGTNLVPDTPGAVLRVGDAVEVLETGPVAQPTGTPR
ncbi:MOSC domain-containing protein [Pseudonocardia hydrocarbonoxydans]|uniref:Molybdenum cofactor biosysynthesis protein n=1 Tax=Pseudonocardia hydrocarbonoxydans TaxID=76726 RepID=A0A4Y3WQ03_9PSEU|nr:MOSC N-terminal beta barrel domain-containing protein [Pseudonocardia hydrocarbonoxydans]GEC20160.1 molybdenum cofactor biosysynthesis protein [Pseudonocardia hydrocarbonoxydans]